MAYYSFSIRDNSDEYGRLIIPVEEPTSLNYETIIATNQASFESALDGVVLGNIARASVTVNEDTVNDTRPASQFAQRELGMRVFIIGASSGKKANFTVPSPDLNALTLQEGTDLVDLDDAGVMAAFVTQVEALARIYAPDGSSEAVTVERAVIVGRNS